MRHLIETFQKYFLVKYFIMQRLRIFFALNLLISKNTVTQLFVFFFTIANESSNVKLPCMFWPSCNNLTFLTELFYKIVIEKDINPKINCMFLSMAHAVLKMRDF